jgi:hypothetical protein
MLTKKDLQIINAALALYEAELSVCPCQIEGAQYHNPDCEIHKEKFGNPQKTIEATRQRVFNQMIKRSVEA